MYSSCQLVERGAYPVQYYKYRGAWQVWKGAGLTQGGGSWEIQISMWIVIRMSKRFKRKKNEIWDKKKWVTLKPCGGGGGGTLGVLIKNGIETFLGSLGDFELFYCPLWSSLHPLPLPSPFSLSVTHPWETRLHKIDKFRFGQQSKNLRKNVW